MLAPGDRGEQVLELQRQLAAAGFDPGQVDGVYGPRTSRAAMQMQQFCRLTEDGIAGQNTIKALALLVPHRVEPVRLLGPHFKEQEFACRCCGMVRVNVYLVVMLEQLREHLGSRPVVITSGYRCPKHNRAVGGAKLSQHLLGNAADIVVTGVALEEVAAVAENLDFTGIGRYKTFTHADIRIGAAAHWFGK